MTPFEIQQLIKQVMPDADVRCDKSSCHLEITIISAQFAHKSKVARQQLVYKGLQEAIQSGALHAVSLTTLTPEESIQGNG